MRAQDPVVAAPSGVGPRPPGDPAGMRELASRLDREAARLRGMRPVRFEHWESDRARQVRVGLQAWTDGLRRSADHLAGLAAELRIEAGHVEDLQLDWATRKALADARHSAIPHDKI